jgi:hypothetical protein
MIAPRVVMFSLLISGAACAQNFTVDTTDTILPANRLIPIGVSYTGQETDVKTFKISSLLFLSDQGTQSLSVEILKQCGDKQTAEAPSANFDLENGAGSLCLRIPESVVEGKYSGSLRVIVGKKPESDKKISFTKLRVRGAVGWALAWLLVGLLVSFVVTKILTGERRRIGLLQQIQDLKVQKGSTLPPLPPVVWVDAVLHLAKGLSERFWLTGADTIDARVNSVRGTVAILRQARELRDGLEQRLDKLISGRAVWEIDRIASELGTETLDDAVATRIKNELAPFNDWLKPTTFPAVFWATIQPDLLALQRDIAAGTVPDAGKIAIGPLKDALDKALAAPPLTSDDAAEAYRAYARLKILWESRGDADIFPKLIAVPAPPLTECFRLADQRAWERLKAAEGLTIKMPETSDPDGFEAFMPLTFSVTGPAAAIGSFLFRHKVQYAWQFKQAPTLKWHEILRRKKEPTEKEVTLTPKTIGPSVVQYFPRRGQVRVSVDLSYNGESFSVPAAPAPPAPATQVPGPNIQDSTDFGVLDLFSRVEYISWLIAVAVAVATGLATYYYKNPAFGSYQDYLTLALWGSGMDQGKNLLQALQAVSGQPAPTLAATR